MCSINDLSEGIRGIAIKYSQWLYSQRHLTIGLQKETVCSGEQRILFFVRKGMPGHIIKRYREMRNFSQKYVAAKMGISQNSYSKIENNITQLTVHHIKQLSSILEVPISDFLRDDFEIHKPITIPGSITRSELIDTIKLLQKKLEAKSTVKHENYLVVMSLLAAADSSLSLVQ